MIAKHGNKRYLLILIFLCSFFLLLHACLTKEPHVDLRHEAGRDTVDLFGDGTFQLMDRNPSVLYDLDHNCVLEEEVYQYKMVDHSLFIYGRQGYTIIDINRKVIQQYVLNTVKKEIPYNYKTYYEKYLLPSYGDQYKKFDTFSQFTEEEQKILKEKKGYQILKKF